MTEEYLKYLYWYLYTMIPSAIVVTYYLSAYYVNDRMGKRFSNFNLKEFWWEIVAVIVLWPILVYILSKKVYDNWLYTANVPDDWYKRKKKPTKINAVKSPETWDEYKVKERLQNSTVDTMDAPAFGGAVPPEPVMPPSEEVREGQVTPHKKKRKRKKKKRR